MLFAAFLVTLAPWVVRHVIILGKPGISSRAEGVLGLRMLLNEQPPLGTIYASSPKPLKQRLGPLLGYSPTDLKAGGKLDGISFVKQRAWGISEQRMEEESYDGKVDSWIRRSTLSKPPYPRHQLRGVP